MAPLLTGRLGLAGVVDAMARAGAIDGAEAGGGKGLDIVPCTEGEFEGVLDVCGWCVRGVWEPLCGDELAHPTPLSAPLKAKKFQAQQMSHDYTNNPNKKARV
eukprot:1160982-Pelagomonas_calceolata.AAC.2